MTHVFMYRKCKCRVHPLSPLDGVGKCPVCGEVPDTMPDYHDYVALQQSRARIVQTVLATKDEALIKAMYDAW